MTPNGSCAPLKVSFYGLLLFLVLLAPACWAGNNEMVNKKVEELDKINKEALSQINDIPSQGKIDFKANVSVRDGKQLIEIIEKNIALRPEGTKTNEPAGGIIERDIDLIPEKIPLGTGNNKPPQASN